ncbi:unnamed protein product [Mytilus coruscus]|uniref:Uncharacterized protein n=1 Tax=Mytilus coruscus TaxID=42192 RepID=A0A6J8CNN9_MYTCO|nr:unnamed protein product [Mytilus coruscus]
MGDVIALAPLNEHMFLARIAYREDELDNGTLILQILPQQYLISGRYVCTVCNGIPDINGRNSQTGFISHNYEGPPIFVQENKNIKFIELFKPTAMTFMICSNPVVEEIWIEAVALCFMKNETVLDFRISETKLLYSDFGNKGFIKGNKITFEFKTISSEYEKYKIWTKNRRGEDSFDFNIQAVGLISDAADNTRQLVTDQERPMLPTRIKSSPQNESNLSTISNRPTVNVSTSAIASNQDTEVNATRCSYNAETEISDKNENQYEISIDNNEETHKYCVVTNKCAEIDTSRPTSVTDEETSNISCRSSTSTENEIICN